jgi:acyl-CoA synthetase (AMP-forming)/AMP-acid ligase II
LPAEPRAAASGERPERLVSAGRPIPEMELRIVDPVSLEDLPVGEHGEIWLRTPQLMKGFLGKPAETAEVVRADGWFRTGDMGKVDEDGFVFVEDRMKDMIISGGENIYSPEIERVLAEHPAVAEVAIIGVPHERWGETVKAVVSLRPGEAASPDELIAYCREHLAAYKCPTSVDMLEALPRNPTGKIMKRVLRKPYWEGRDRSIV